MPIVHQPGTRIAVSLGVDFDAHTVWEGSFGFSSPSYLSRGEFCADVATPRLLNLFRRNDIQTTWCTPTHTMETFPGSIEQILSDGHEIAAHGCRHERIGALEVAEERRLLDQQMKLHKQFIGREPRGYRSPSWDFSPNTLALLEEYGFDWDSSLMGRDFEAYRPRPLNRSEDGPHVFGEPSPIIEIPVSWYLDDFPALEYVSRINPGLASTEVTYQRWKDHFDFAYEEVPNAIMALTVHPQTIGRASNFLMFRRLIDYMKSKDGVAFMTLSEICDTWRD
ncbi:polysaccharide deacetylase [Rhizobium sp. NZLR11]|uniref:polysaccharide deacetylase family protein n=1 Tax=Rhizobium sp. NZLR11 TaxID=2731098 RepID=UPI001C82ED8F|nr:polysaccharide deacetylase [Rhizobium sp. NZLR11]MBX5212136.1 polysaccharide deacetylase [Rhizobium sp. NZLR11]